MGTSRMTGAYITSHRHINRQHCFCNTASSGHIFFFQQHCHGSLMARKRVVSHNWFTRAKIASCCAVAAKSGKETA